MTLVRQNIYAAYLDGDVSPVETLRTLCDEYEEIDSTYRDFEKIRESVRAQISVVVEKLGGKATVKGFGELKLMEPGITQGFDKAMLRALINDLIGDYPDIAARIVACETKSARAGSLRIEREKK